MSRLLWKALGVMVPPPSLFRSVETTVLIGVFNSTSGCRASPSPTGKQADDRLRRCDALLTACARSGSRRSARDENLGSRAFLHCRFEPFGRLRPNGPSRTTTVLASFSCFANDPNEVAPIGVGKDDSQLTRGRILDAIFFVFDRLERTHARFPCAGTSIRYHLGKQCMTWNKVSLPRYLSAINQSHIQHAMRCGQVSDTKPLAGCAHPIFPAPVDAEYLRRAVIDVPPPLGYPKQERSSDITVKDRYSGRTPLSTLTGQSCFPNGRSTQPSTTWPAIATTTTPRPGPARRQSTASTRVPRLEVRPSVPMNPNVVSVIVIAASAIATGLNGLGGNVCQCRLLRASSLHCPARGDGSGDLRCPTPWYRVGDSHRAE